MPKKSREEVEENPIAEVTTVEVNEYLRAELADEDDVRQVERVTESISTTRILSALEQIWQDGYEDEIGAALLKEFRIKFARHELITA